jgi:hypothetical protein
MHPSAINNLSKIDRKSGKSCMSNTTIVFCASVPFKHSASPRKLNGFKHQFTVHPHKSSTQRL